MRAIVLTRYGDPQFFEEREVGTPAANDEQVLVEVAATSVNPVDTKIRRGGRAMCPDLPAILHMDVAGTVVEVGSGVSRFQVGDEVFGCAGGLKTVAGEDLGGALAQYMCVDPRLIAHKPAGLSMIQAAALPLVTITAWEGLYRRARILPGQTVLVHGGAGGVGHIAVQLAKTAGARVFATASSPDKIEAALEFGADHVIPYREMTPEAYVERYTGGEGFDVVFDTVGGENLDRSLAAAKVGGAVVTILAMSHHDLAPMHHKGLSLHAVFMLVPMLYGARREVHGEILAQAAQMAEQNQLRPLIDPETFGFSEVGAAHTKLEQGKAFGKIALASDL